MQAGKKSYALFTHVAGARMDVNQWERKEEAGQSE